jgi:type IV secretory pathway VirB3-like protein
MNNRLLVVESDEGTTISVTAPNGEKRVFFFFTEPETPEEAEAQVQFRTFKQIFSSAHKLLGKDIDYYESPARLLIVPAAILGLILGIFAHVLIGVGAFIALTIAVVIYASKLEDPVNEDRRWFKPVNDMLMDFSEKNDFAGALSYSVGLVGR